MDIVVRKERIILLLSRLDLPPPSLRILGSAELVKFVNKNPDLDKIL